MSTTALSIIPPQTAQVFRKLSDYQVKGAFFSRTEMVLEPGLPENEWMELGRVLAKVSQSANWWCGDYISYGRRTYGSFTKSRAKNSAGTRRSAPASSARKL